MEKQQVFYIHGGDSIGDYNKFLEYLQKIDITDLPWAEEKPKRWNHKFREDLGEEFEVFMPLMPNKLNAKYTEWKIWFEKHFEYIRDDVVLVGYSLGGLFLAKYLVENDVPFKVKALYFVAAVYGDGSLVDEDGDDGGDFLYDVSLVPTIADKVGSITLLHSKDDFVVPYDHVLKYRKALPEAELVTFEDKNHFLVEELPELIERIKAL